MQLTKTIFLDSATFIEKKRVENWLWCKNEFLWRIYIYIISATANGPPGLLLCTGGPNGPALAPEFKHATIFQSLTHLQVYSLQTCDRTVASSKKTPSSPYVIWVPLGSLQISVVWHGAGMASQDVLSWQCGCRWHAWNCLVPKLANLLKIIARFNQATVCANSRVNKVIKPICLVAQTSVHGSSFTLIDFQVLGYGQYYCGVEL